VKTAIGTIAKTQRTSLLNAVRDLIACLPKIVQITLLHQYWRKMSNNPPKFHPNRLLTQEEIEVRVWASVVLIVTIILAGIVIFMLYSLAFVVQPIKSMAPIDQSFAKMLNDIVLLIVGGIGGVMSRKGVQAVADKVSLPTTPTTPLPVSAPQSVTFSNLPVWVNPPLDEEWRAPPPPTTPPDFLHPEREEIAKERASK
jgi:hypothetical protein